MQHLSNTAHPYAQVSSRLDTKTPQAKIEGSVTWTLPQGRPDIPTRILAWLAEKTGVVSAAPGGAQPEPSGRLDPAAMIVRLRAARQACEAYQREVQLSKMALGTQLASLILESSPLGAADGALALQPIIRSHSGDGQPLTERSVRAITQDVLRFQQTRAVDRLLEKRLAESPLAGCGLAPGEMQTLREVIRRQAEHRLESSTPVPRRASQAQSLEVRALADVQIETVIDDILPPTAKELEVLFGAEANDTDRFPPILMRLTRDILKRMQLQQSLMDLGLAGAPAVRGQEAGSPQRDAPILLKAALKNVVDGLVSRGAVKNVDPLYKERAAALARIDSLMWERAAKFQGRPDEAELLLTLEGLASAMKAGVLGQDEAEFARLAPSMEADCEARFATVGS